MSMLELAAKAIYRRAQASMPPNEVLLSWEAAPAGVRAEFLDYVRVALEAVRLADDAMVTAGENAIEYPDDPDGSPPHVQPTWTAMVDAILGGK